MATTTKNMTFDVNLLPLTTGDHNLGSSSLKWNLHVNTINGTEPILTDTKNTAGSTNSISKLFLIGATNQNTNPITYSNTNVFITDGMLSTKAIGINYGTDTNKVTMQWNNTDQSLDFIFT